MVDNVTFLGLGRGWVEIWLVGSIIGPVGQVGSRSGWMGTFSRSGPPEGQIPGPAPGSGHFLGPRPEIGSRGGLEDEKRALPRVSKGRFL
jgi:hypothetical protein